MPIQKLNRIIKQYRANLEGFDVKKFVELVEKLSDDPILSPVLAVNMTLQFDGVQANGDLKEIRSLLDQISPDDRPYTFQCNITTNANPRKQLAITISFGQSLVTFNLQNTNQEEGKGLLELFTKALPEIAETKVAIKKDSEKSTPIVKQEVPTEFLPGAFRPIPMPSLSDRDVFVIMSFNEEFRDTYILAIKPTLEKLGFKPIRVDEIQHNATVTPEIMRQIERSAFVVADLTGERPNVYYEVGYAHRADKEVILMAQKEHAVHFDVAAINRINYIDLTELTHALELRVKTIKERLGISDTTPPKK